MAVILVVGGASWSERADSDARKPEVNMATELAKQEAGATAVIRHGGATSYVKLGAVVVPTRVEVVSMANDNSMFQLRVRMAKVPADRWPVVGNGGTWWRAESHGGDATGGDASFTLPRADAEGLAKSFGVPLRERAKLDGGLVYTWKVAKTASTKKTDKIAVTLRVENKGKAPIGFLEGGMFSERGDDRFVPEIALAGKPVELIKVYGANGGMQYKKIAPGKSIEVTTDLRGYPQGAFATAGRYKVALRYEGTVAVDGMRTSAPEDQAKIWDVAPATTATIVVK
ncbi:MAG: hypothetical protein ABI175_00915 [Polyangiales bacterium]